MLRQPGSACLRALVLNKIHPILKVNVSLIYVYLPVAEIPREETKGPRWQVNEHPPVVPLIPKEQEGEFTTKLVSCN